LVYGYKIDDESKDLIIIREYVYGKNFYSLRDYDFLGDRLIGFYKCLSLIEYVHSFKAFIRCIKPEKFIIGSGLTIVKLVDLIKHDNRYLTSIQNSSKIEEVNRSMKYIHPDLLFENLEENSLERSVDFEVVKRADFWTVGCFLYYAFTKKDPWERCNTRDEIKKEYDEKKLFFKEEDIKDWEYVKEGDKFALNEKGEKITKDKPLSSLDLELVAFMKKCLVFHKDTLLPDEATTTLREKLEERPNIKGYITESGRDLEMDYPKGIIYILTYYRN